MKLYEAIFCLISKNAKLNAKEYFKKKYFKDQKFDRLKLNQILLSKYNIYYDNGNNNKKLYNKIKIKGAKNLILIKNKNEWSTKIHQKGGKIDLNNLISFNRYDKYFVIKKGFFNPKYYTLLFRNNFLFLGRISEDDIIREQDKFDFKFNEQNIKFILEDGNDAFKDINIKQLKINDWKSFFEIISYIIKKSGIGAYQYENPEDEQKYDGNYIYKLLTNNKE